MTNLILNVYKFILMKRLLFAGLLGVITSLGLRAGEPTTMWPYLFDDFMEASIYSKSGNKGEAKVNIHLLRNDLHYLNGSQIYCPDNQNDIGRVVFADRLDDGIVPGAVSRLVQAHGDALSGRVVHGLVNLVAGNGADDGTACRRSVLGVAAAEHGSGETACHRAHAGAGIGVIGLDLDGFHAGDRTVIGFLDTADFIHVVGVRGAEIGAGGNGQRNGCAADGEDGGGFHDILIKWVEG